MRVAVETLIQYLLLDKTYAERPDFEGAKYVMSPPLRDERNQPVLWNGLRDGLVQTVATDHAPFDFKTQKPMGRDDFTKIPNGIPSLEERVNLLYTHGVKAGKLDLHTFVNVASTQVAKLFGLFPRKGTIQLGADADLVVFDPDYRGKISAKTQHDERRLQRVRRLGDRRPPERRHRARRSGGARWEIRRHDRPRPDA